MKREERKKMEKIKVGKNFELSYDEDTENGLKKLEF